MVSESRFRMLMSVQRKIHPCRRLSQWLDVLYYHLVLRDFGTEIFRGLKLRDFDESFFKVFKFREASNWCSFLYFRFCIFSLV